MNFALHGTLKQFSRHLITKLLLFNVLFLCGLHIFGLNDGNKLNKIVKLAKHLYSKIFYFML